MADLRACPVCGKLVDIDSERHNLFHCRNFLLASYYRERNAVRRKRLLERVEAVNARLGLRSMNLVDNEEP